ncbi:hypothetical protein [Variovorax sp. PBS-H4]|uniref:hypothetical protein n=1 Tax=Variovorax sp. PBS-H4 TaxID=434008 RepID=UPI0013A579E2|nr:hypothetical protein [Variovorax sp. PBS-H4]
MKSFYRAARSLQRPWWNNWCQLRDIQDAGTWNAPENACKRRAVGKFPVEPKEKAPTPCGAGAGGRELASAHRAAATIYILSIIT